MLIIACLASTARAQLTDVYIPPVEPDVTTAEAGTHGDPIRALELDPAVVASSAGAIDGLALRGDAPADARVYVDGFAVPLLYHFGVRGVLPDEALHATKLTTGAFGVERGGVTSGYLELDTPARGNAFDLSTEQLSARRSAVINRKLPVTFTLRIGLLSAWNRPQLVLPSAQRDTHLTSGPGFGDFTFATEHEILDHWKLAVRGLFSDEHAALYTERTDRPEARLATNRTFGRATVIATYREYWNATIAASVMPYQYNYERGLVQHERDDSLALDARVDAKRHIGWVWGLRRFGLIVGGDVHLVRHDLDIAMPLEARENTPQLAEPALDNTSQRFTGIVWRPEVGAWFGMYGNFTDAIGARVASRLDAFGSDLTLQPRFELDDDVTGHVRLALRAGTYRRPTDQREELEHPELHPERATQVDVSFSYHYDKASIDAVLYYVDRTHLVERLGDQLLATGRGTDAGGEVTLQRVRGAWLRRLAFGLSHSTRQDGPRMRDRPSAYDQPVRLEAMLAWKSDAWLVSGRFELRSGLPYTPVQAATYDVDRDTYVPIAGVQYGERAPLHHQLDLRVDYRFAVRSKLDLDAYLDIANVYDNRGAAAYVYSYDFTQRSALEALPLWVTVGIKGSL